MDTVLVVEDTKLFANILKKELSVIADVRPVVAETYAQAKQWLEDGSTSCFVALLDLNLPDAPNGEIVDLVMQYGIPIIVFTGEFNDELREKMISKKVVDYILKENAYSVGQVVALVKRVRNNRAIKVLVVDDSRSARVMLKEMLKTHMYEVLEAANGIQALQLLEQYADIRLVITDYNMPEMDGFELTKQIRQKYDKNDLAIIGLSSYGNNVLSARFIKHGANDFINKPFLAEEFFVRISQNIEMLEYIFALKESAIRDFLTGLHNRGYFMTTANQLYAQARQGKARLVAGILDVDFFKKVNDTHGHEAGDEVLKRVAGLLKKLCRPTDLVARMGGEEFTIMLVDQSPEEAWRFFEQLRLAIEAAETPYKDLVLRITVSMGVNCAIGATLTEMLDQADQNLYAAKKGGRNQVVMSD